MLHLTSVHFEHSFHSPNSLAPSFRSRLVQLVVEQSVSTCILTFLYTGSVKLIFLGHGLRVSSLGSLRQPTVVLYVTFVHNSNVIHTKWRESDESVTVTISRWSDVSIVPNLTCVPSVPTSGRYSLGSGSEENHVHVTWTMLVAQHWVVTWLNDLWYVGNASCGRSEHIFKQDILGYCADPNERAPLYQINMLYCMLERTSSVPL